MDTDTETLQEIETALIGQQRLLVALTHKVQAHPEAAGTLVPLVAKLKDWTEYLTRVRDELRLSVVAQRT